MKKQWKPRNQEIITTVTSVLFLFGVIIILIMAIPSWADWANKYNRLPAKICLLIAATFPPLWLWIEFCFIWRTAPEDERPTLEDFKYGQEVGRNIWLAFVGLIIALYFKN
jgi:hypothetical protein